MTLLPVVEREVRVGARDRATYIVRFVAAMLTIGFSGFSLWFVPVFMDETPIRPRELFLILAWIEYLFVLLAGFTITCDAISQEKRESTLGLLFLTDLKGYDIVLGKLCAAGLRGIYALLATFPVLALPLMLGGTNLGELARTALTLLVTLFFSMAAGLLASAIARRNWSAFAMAGSIVLVFAAGLPLHSELVRNFYGEPRLAYFIALPSPTTALLISLRAPMWAGGPDFAISLTVILGFALLAVIAAVIVTPRVWKDRPPARRIAKLIQFARNLKIGAAEARVAFRRKLMEKNPIFWLSRRERVSALGMLGLILVCGVVAGWFGSRNWIRGGWTANIIVPFIAWTLCGGIIHGLIVLRLAVLAAERFGEDRRLGALELTLSTPIRIKEVLAGHWMGLRRYFAGPALMVFPMHILSLYLFLNVQYLHESRFFGPLELLIQVWRHIFFVPLGPIGWEFHIGVLLLLGSIPVLLLDWVALAWLSTWLSLRVKIALAAPIGALILLHVPPVIALGAIGLFLEENRLFPNHDFSEALVIYFLGAFLMVFHQLLCIAWSRKQLYLHFRTAATDRYQPATAQGWKALWNRVRAIFPGAETGSRRSPPEIVSPSSILH